MLTKNAWRAIALLAIIGACLALLLSSFGGDSVDQTPINTSLGQALDVGADPLVVVQVRVVQNATDAGARDACNALSTPSSEWIITGKNLKTSAAETSDSSSDDAYTYLCMQQARVSRLNDSATSISSTVLQSVRVLRNMTSCPSPLVNIFSPRSGVAICGQPISADVAVKTGMYVSDVTATLEKSYYDAVPGWVTDPTSVAVSSDDAVYLAYKRPLRPIVSMAAIPNVTKAQALGACSNRLGEQWEQAGYAMINQTIVCVERPVLKGSDVESALVRAGPILTNVCMVRTTTGCYSSWQRLQLTSDWSLCVQYTDSAAVVSYIGELRLQWAISSTVSSAFSASGFEVKSLSSPTTSTKPVIVVYRQHAGIVVMDTLSTSTSTNSSNSIQPSPTPTPGSKPPLLARVSPTPASSTRRLRLGATEDSSTLKFKVLQLADLHYTGDSSYECSDAPEEMIANGTSCTEATNSAFVASVLDLEQPDFVVFSGDNVQVPSGGSLSAAIKALTAPVESRQIPYAVVFGNHDDEGGFSRAQIANAIMALDHSYMQWGPTSISGVGNYELSVHAPVGGAWGSAGDSVFRMYFLDSHGYPDTDVYPGVVSKYDWIKPDQIAYYRELSEANRAQSNGSALPAVMFFHIPLPEYAGVGSASHRSGEKNEDVMSPEVNSNLFTSLVEMDEVKATFCGHDHTNEYCYERQGIQLCYGGGAGLGRAYGSGSFARRVRVIEWSVDSSGKRQLRSWKQHHGRTFGTRQSEEVLYQEA